ncbi:MAG TPA: hypothetical protein VIG99_17530 [Myxococcaceae bacterium]
MSALPLMLVAAGLGVSQQVVVLPVRTAAVTAARATAVSERVAQILRAGGVTLASTPSEAMATLRSLGAGDPSECRGDSACVAKLGALLGARLVVGIGVGEFEGTVAVHLEVVAAPPDGATLIDDELLPADLKDPLWARARAPFARNLLQRTGTGARSGESRAQPAASSDDAPPRSGDWMIALQTDTELGAFGGMYTLRAGRRLFPEVTVSAGAIVTAARLAGASVQARAIPFAADFAVHPVVALEIPVLFSGPVAAGVRPSVGLEVSPFSWLSLGASASYLRLLGTAPEYKSGYWLAGAEMGLRL